MSGESRNALSRRAMLKLLGAGGIGVAGSSILAACTQPEPQVVKETVIVEEEVEKTVIVEEQVEVEVEVEKVVTATPPPVESVELRTMYHSGMPEDWVERCRSIFDDFEALNPAITVKDEWVPEVWDKIQTEYAAGGGPDVIINQMDWLVPGAARGMFVNLIPYLNRDAVDTSDWWYDPTLEWEWKGGLYAGLLYAGGQALYINTDLLSEAGLDFPDDDWTWDDFLDYCLALTDPDKKQYGCMGTTGNPPYWSCSFIHGMGGSVLNERSDSCTINEPEAQAALQWLSDLLYVHEVQPTPAAMMGLDDFFLSGNVAFNFSGTWGESATREAGFNWDFARMPVHPDTGIRSVQLGSNGWSILTTTKYPDQGWELVKYLINEPGQRGFMANGIPGSKAVVGSAEYQDAHAPQNINRVIADFECCGHNYYPTPDCGQWWSAMSAELDLIWSGEATVEEATQKACEAVERIFAERPEEWS
jgi:multiple sugar transport system substrate-binding protein